MNFWGFDKVDLERTQCCPYHLRGIIIDHPYHTGYDHSQVSVILRYLHLRVGILFQERVFSIEQISTTYKMSAYRRTSIPLRLGPLSSECYNTTSMRTHHRESIPLRLGPIPSECYFMVSTYECRHTLHARVLSTEQISTAYKCRPCPP